MARIDKTEAFPRNFLNEVFQGEDLKYDYDIDEFIDYVFNHLTEMQKRVIISRFKDKLSMREVAECLNRNKESIRRTENKVIRLVRLYGTNIFKNFQRGGNPNHITLQMLNNQLSVRAMNCIKRGFRYENHRSINDITVADLIDKFADGSIKKFRNLGVDTYNEILSVLRSLDIDVKTDDQIIEAQRRQLLKTKTLDAPISVLDLPNDIYLPLYRTGRNLVIRELIEMVHNYPETKVYGIGNTRINRIKTILEEHELL